LSRISFGTIFACIIFIHFLPIVEDYCARVIKRVLGGNKHVKFTLYQYEVEDNHFTKYTRDSETSAQVIPWHLLVHRDYLVLFEAYNFPPRTTIITTILKGFTKL
jgi:hypothetical protein